MDGHYAFFRRDEMSSEEVDISSALNGKTPVKKSRKRRSDSKEEDEESPEKPTEYPSVFGAIGTPMAKLENAKEWEEWKEKELEKERIKWRKYLQSKWDLRESKLPMVSESEHLLGRHEHYARIREAREQVEKGLEAINERNFNVGKGSAINIQINGKNVPKKKTKKFAAAIEKALSQMGNPTIEEILTDDMDEEEARAEKEWERKRAKKTMKSRIFDAEIDDFEQQVKFEPWEEFCEEMEELGKDDKIGEKEYQKWLIKKIEENAVSPNFNAYQLDLLCLDKDGLKNKKSLKSVVRKVQNFYRKMRGSPN